MPPPEHATEAHAPAVAPKHVPSVTIGSRANAAPFRYRMSCDVVNTVRFAATTCPVIVAAVPLTFPVTLPVKFPLNVPVVVPGSVGFVGIDIVTPPVEADTATWFAVPVKLVTPAVAPEFNCTHIDVTLLHPHQLGGFTAMSICVGGNPPHAPLGAVVTGIICGFVTCPCAHPATANTHTTTAKCFQLNRIMAKL